MKKILAGMLFMIWIVPAFAQPVQPPPEGSREYYLKKSKSQKTTAWIMLLGGAAVTTGGAIWLSQTFSLFGPATSEESTASLLVVVGTGAMIGSIPLFIASSRNAKRAGNLSMNIHWEKAPVTGPGQIGQRPFPVAALRFRIK